MLRMEEERKVREEEERAERDAEKRRRRRAKAGLDPDGLTEDDFKSKKASSVPPEDEEEAVVDAYQSSFRNEEEFMMVAPESEAIDDFEYEHTLGAAIHNSDLRFEEMSEKLVQAQIAMEESEKSLEATRLSHKLLQSEVLDKMDNRLPADGNPSFEFDEVEGEVNMNGSNMAEVLSEQKAQDIKDIERL